MDGMIAMLPKPFQALSTHIDFQGQKVAERTYQVILTLSGIVGFFVGWYNQQLSHAIITVIGAAAFTGLIILPPWPFLFRKHPVVWQIPKEDEEKEKKDEDNGEKKEKKEEKKEKKKEKKEEKNEKKEKKSKKDAKKNN